MKKFIFIVCMVLLLFIGTNPLHAKAIPLGYDGNAIDYSGNYVIHKNDLKQKEAKTLLAEYWDGEVTETDDISWSAADSSDRFGTWTSSQSLIGKSWKASVYWQVFASDPNQSSGTWDLTALWAKAGRMPDLSNIKGYIGDFTVNEPATMLLLGCGLICVAYLGRRRLIKKSKRD